MPIHESVGYVWSGSGGLPREVSSSPCSQPSCYSNTSKMGAVSTVTSIPGCRVGVQGSYAPVCVLVLEVGRRLTRLARGEALGSAFLLCQ